MDGSQDIFTEWRKKIFEKDDGSEMRVGFVYSASIRFVYLCVVTCTCHVMMVCLFLIGVGPSGRKDFFMENS
jgi:hypothetical protein